MRTILTITSFLLLMANSADAMECYVHRYGNRVVYECDNGTYTCYQHCFGNHCHVECYP